MKNNIKGSASAIIDAPVEKVWDALTKPNLIKKYLFGTDTHTDWTPGSKITFTGEWEGRSYEDKGTVIDVQKNKKIKYSYWSEMSGIEDKPENYVDITYDLVTEGDKTKLTITQENIPDEKMKEHSVENWKKVMSNLKELVEKERIES